MDQIKIGKFIAARRKTAGLTQMQLAEKLGITDRAVSKWENGRSLPDASIMLELCEALDISVNDLLCGEVVTVEDYNKKLEENLIEAVREKEAADKRLLSIEIVVGVISIAFLLAMEVVSAYVQAADWVRIVLMVVGFIPIAIALPFMLKIEQVAGYYECKKCGHRYVPSMKAINLAPHMGRTRHMKCPKCGEKSWQKKVISKEDK